MVTEEPKLAFLYACDDFVREVVGNIRETDIEFYFNLCHDTEVGLLGVASGQRRLSYKPLQYYHGYSYHRQNSYVYIS